MKLVKFMPKLTRSEPCENDYLPVYCNGYVFYKGKIVLNDFNAWEDRAVKERKLDILILIKNYLLQEGYTETVKCLTSETRLPVDYVLCDNLDLCTIVEDFEYYYQLRFQRYPKIVKKLGVGGGGGGGAPCRDKRKESRKVSKAARQQQQPPPPTTVTDLSDDCLTVNSAFGACFQSKSSKPNETNRGEGDAASEVKLWRGLGQIPGYSDEWKFFADVISKEVIDRNLNVKWSDVVGLDAAKQLLKEAIVFPIKYPDLFKDIISPWKGLLLYGPSGTGKTLLAKAVATECKTTFFNISASSIVSKWRGESEKLVRVMFELARHQAPSTIFIDELDALASKRDGPHEHEASRRLKTELLVQMDGLIESVGNIFLLTTSNLPWDLDNAILRRLEKRIFVDLPEVEARRQLFAFHLPPKLNNYITTQLDYDYLAKESKGYSGADIKLVCKEAIMQALRPLFPLLETPTRVDTKAWMSGTVIGTKDVLNALDRTKPTISDVTKFKIWEDDHGSA